MPRVKDPTFYKTTVKHDQCRRMDDVLAADFLESVAYIEHDEAHIFSQVIAHRALACKEPLAAVATVLSRVAERCEIETTHGHSYGIKHAFIWTLVGTHHGTASDLWDIVARDLCPPAAGRTGGPVPLPTWSRHGSHNADNRTGNATASPTRWMSK